MKNNDTSFKNYINRIKPAEQTYFKVFICYSILSGSISKYKWAKQVVCIEQNISVSKRLNHQKKYAYNLDSGKKAFIVRWKITVIKILFYFFLNSLAIYRDF